MRNTSSKNVTRGFEKICVEFHRLKLIFKSKVRVIITVRERKVQTNFFFTVFSFQEDPLMIELIKVLQLLRNFLHCNASVKVSSSHIIPDCQSFASISVVLP